MDVSRAFVALFAFILISAPMSLLAEQGDQAEIESIRKTLQERFPKMTIVDVQRSRFLPLYEVFTGRQIYYTDGSADFLFRGVVVDTRDQRNVTEERVDERNAIDFGSLPFDRAVKIVRGDGTRKLAVFSDPDCPFCRKLEGELKSVSDVTLYIFLLPLPQIHPKAEVRAKAIWCARDRASAWTQYMLEKKEPQAAPCAEDPVASTRALAEKLNISGTPTLYFENGSRVGGAPNASEIEGRMMAARGGP